MTAKQNVVQRYARYLFLEFHITISPFYISLVIYAVVLLSRKVAISSKALTLLIRKLVIIGPFGCGKTSLLRAVVHGHPLDPLSPYGHPLQPKVSRAKLASL